MRKSFQNSKLGCQNHIFSTFILDMEKRKIGALSNPSNFHSLKVLQALTPSMLREFLQGKNNPECEACEKA